MTDLPSHARTVIIGGGIVGCSTAYHLARMSGYGDIVILERQKLTSGSTFHAAGLVGQLRSSANVTQLLKYSVELYETIEQETGYASGWKKNGGLRLACTPERMTENQRLATMARSFGLEMHLLTPSEAKDLWPLMDISDVLSAAFLPTDGQASPSDLAQAMAKGARMRGAKVFEDCAVSAIEVKDGRVRAVVTPLGRIECEVVVNCGGLWARKIGALAGVNVPVQAVQHQYLITEPFAEKVPRTLPTLRDPDRIVYFKEEVGGMVMGGYEPDPLPWALDRAPDDFHFKLLQSDWDHFEQLMVQAMHRVPALAEVGVRQLVNGPEAFTPDGWFILGEAPEVRGFFVGAGFNAFGIASAGGAGRALAEWIAAGEAPVDLWPVDIKRFGAVHRDPAFVEKRTLESYGKHYTIAWPGEEYKTGRPIRVSPLYDRLRARGACFGWKMGWERPNWFAPEGVEPKDRYSFQRPGWFEHVRREHLATRESVAIFDETSFAKYLVTGEDAEAALQWICSNDVAKAPGSLTYTQMLNARGGIMCDLTVSRLSQDVFYIITSTGSVTHDRAWIEVNIPQGMDVQVSDVTSAFAVIAVMGPKARDVLSSVTQDDVSNAALPFGTAREIVIAGAPVRALRITYVGELGWELHVPSDSAGAVYDALFEAGRPFGIINAGYRAIESLRLEKAYRVWGSDIGPDFTPLEAGLGWAVKLKKPIPFLGREALERQSAEGALKRRFACFTVTDPDAFIFGRETIYRDGERVGWLTSGGYGHTVERMIGFGYIRDPSGVTNEYLMSGRFELEVATRRVPCEIHPRTVLYDPKNERVKA